jgi:hypothetical protein
MTAGVGQKIDAGDYNAIRNKVASILGVGSGQSGYGQSVISGQVVAGNKINLSEWLNLRSDLRTARQHQTGVDESANLTIPTTTYLKRVSTLQIREVYLRILVMWSFCNSTRLSQA